MSERARHAFEFVPAPEDLAPYLNSLYILRIAPIGLEEMLPAYSGQLLISDGASGRIDFGQGFVESPPHAAAVGPLSHAYPLKIDGPATLLGASMSFYGWAAITGLPATQFGDRFLDVATALGQVVSDATLELAGDLQAGRIEARAGLDRMADILRPCAAPLPERHRELIEAAFDWISSGLNPPTAELYGRLQFSNRQVQRLVKRFFGLTPSRLKRRYRAIRAATLLADSQLDEALRLEVLNAFYDQAHLIREIREFTGNTPRVIASSDDSIMPATLRQDGYGAVDVFGGNEARQLAKYQD